MTHGRMAFLTSVSMFAVVGAAHAQVARTEPQQIEEVVVTGSRVIRDGTAAPTPVTVLGAEQLQAQAPTNVADALNQLPQFRGSMNQRAQSYASAASAGQGNYLNLRGLGVKRTLIMLDGVRAAPTHYNGSVDINLLPQALIERVDVVTGGASAAYGSDAVTGVVNLVLDKRFTGIKGSASIGQSRRHDAETNKLTLAAGAPLMDGRAHVEASYEHFQGYGFNNEDRPVGAQQTVYLGTGTAANPQRTFTGTRYNNASSAGIISLAGSPINGFTFNADGTIRRANLGTPLGTGTSSIVGGGEGAYYSNFGAMGYLRTDQGFARGSFELTPSTEVYLQSNWGESRNKINSFFNSRFPTGPTAITIFRDNAFLRPEVVAAMGTAQSFKLGRFIDETGPGHTDTLNNSLSVQTGIVGDLGGGWKYDASLLHGFSLMRVRSNEWNSQHLYAGLDAVRDAGGNIVCRVSLTNPGLYPGCVPINLLGQNSVSPQAVDYIKDISRFSVRNEMNMAAVNLNGELFHTWAGPIAVGFGGEVRKQTLEQLSNGDPAKPYEKTGIRGIPEGSQRFRTANVGVASGEVSVKEAYGELLVPILKDAPWAQALDLNAAGRVIHYSTSGTVATWKLGFSYLPYSDLRFRGTLSRDIAAPSLYQLFAGQQALSNNAVDPHTGVSTQHVVYSQGNPTLQPETARMMVGGFVFTPSQVPGLAITLDAYRIKIHGAIQEIGNVAILQRCEDSNGTSPLCNDIIRPFPFSDRSPANTFTAVYLKPLNLALLEQSGVDMEVSYSMPVGSIFSDSDASLTLRALGSYLRSNKTTDGEGQPTFENAGCCQNPRVTGNVSVSYRDDRLTVGVTGRGHIGYKRSFTRIWADHVEAPPIFYVDLDAAYRFGGNRQYEAFLNVENLFDMDPPLLAGDSGNIAWMATDKTMYDFVGTTFTAGIRFKF